MGEQLIAEIVKMAQLRRNRYGLLYQTPEGVYALSGEDGLTGSSANRYVISTNQLRNLMWDMRITPGQVAQDESVAAKLAAEVAERR